MITHVSLANSPLRSVSDWVAETSVSQPVTDPGIPVVHYDLSQPPVTSSELKFDFYSEDRSDRSTSDQYFGPTALSPDICIQSSLQYCPTQDDSAFGITLGTRLFREVQGVSVNEIAENLEDSCQNKQLLIEDGEPRSKEPSGRLDALSICIITF
ncbi:unnamed protein product [Protopolystoma xenopodis]|uniref:Uncharacterized protein n=1 Tax=Protopolystoma xenopodis TaxID=117903 RepID=A0A3S5BQ47_9PLAT|nr:unnamed protein product [Protopolystoma xenopodis]